MRLYHFAITPTIDPEIKAITVNIWRDTHSHAHNTAVVMARQLGYVVPFDCAVECICVSERED